MILLYLHTSDFTLYNLVIIDLFPFMGDTAKTFLYMLIKTIIQSEDKLTMAANEQKIN